MAKGDNTRERIVSEGLARATRGGLASVTVGTTASTLAMSKSGLFAHFGSKEALQLAIVEKAVERFSEKVIKPSMRHESATKRLAALVDGYIGWMEGDSELSGCPFSAMVPELCDRSGPVRDALVEAQCAWRKLLATTVGEAQREGQITRDAKPEQIAFELVGAILAYQLSLKLLSDPSAPIRARAAVNHILHRS